MTLLVSVVARDLRLAGRRPAEALLPIAFFVVAASLFPLGVGPEPQTLRQVGPGVAWVAALLAAMLSLGTLYAADLDDGSLEQMLIASGRGLPLGVVAGKAVPGFRHASSVETFVALEAHIDNWRWAGVPFRLVTGKRLAERTSEVHVTFRPVSHWLFDRPDAKHATPNRLRVQLQPEEEIELGLMLDRSCRKAEELTRRTRPCCSRASTGPS